MKIGDKVRFIDAVGGGVVSGFQGRDIVLVEDEDGFDIPVLINNCVVIDNDKEKRIKDGANTAPKNTTVTPQPEPEPADKPITFKPKAQERKGGDKLNIFLCFEPTTTKDLGKSQFDLYLVNDSNYCLSYTLMSGENTIWMLRHIDTIEPNTKAYVETIYNDGLNELQHICLQAIAFKDEKTFMLKQPVNTEIRMDLTKFYKLHLFAPNDFFNTPVLTIPIVENDTPPFKLKNTPLTQTTFAKDPLPKTQKDTKPSRDKKQDEVVDLHASELLDTTAGMSAADILEFQLDVFRKKMKEVAKIKGKRIVFIHGKGEGVLRSNIMRELKNKYPRCNWQDASFKEYGFGATLVIIH